MRCHNENVGLLLSEMLMFSSGEHEEKAVSRDKLGLRLLTLSDLDTKSVLHKYACAHMQVHTSSEARAEGDNQRISLRAETHSTDVL